MEDPLEGSQTRGDASQEGVRGLAQALPAALERGALAPRRRAEVFSPPKRVKILALHPFKPRPAFGAKPPKKASESAPVLVPQQLYSVDRVEYEADGRAWYRLA